MSNVSLVTMLALADGAEGSDLWNLQYVQLADAMYRVAKANGVPAEVRRTAVWREEQVAKFKRLIAEE